MITVIIAGGSGTRLWPLSTPEYPKHLLKLIGDKTLLQSSYDRAKTLGGKVYVVTEASHADHVREQLPELSEDAFIIEPGRRGTAHCIVMALDYISRRHDRNEPVAFIHSDHHVRDTQGFARSFNVADKISSENRTICLIGIEPNYPATGFGYIKRDGAIDESLGVYKVESFKEKPDFDTAQEYLETGSYLWNCGYFVGSVNTFVETMERDARNLAGSFNRLALISDEHGDEYKEAYLSLDNQVIDIALLEKTNNLAVVSASFDWVDIGSFKDLHANVRTNSEGNYSRGENIYTSDVEGVFIRNEETKPIVVIGLDNVVVVNTPNGLLVTRRSSSQKVGEFAKKIQGNK